MKEKKRKKNHKRLAFRKDNGKPINSLFLLLASPTFAQDLETVGVNADESINPLQ